jgi:hypothetical protein
MDTMDTEQGTCDVCGEALPEGAYFCGECGSSVPEFGAPQRTSSPSVTPPASAVVDALVPEVIIPKAIIPDVSAPEMSAPVEIPTADVLHDPVVSETVAPEPTHPVRPYTLVFSTGERAQVVGRGLIGRMPEASAGDTWDHLIVVNDPSKTVSKTHLQVEARPEGLLVTDLASANGTVVSMPGIAAERLAPQERVILTPGATVGMGDQSFTIE